jgi:MYXO-CTERM domain-containing protein
MRAKARLLRTAALVCIAAATASRADSVSNPYANLQYFGGRILDRVEVYSVNWGTAVDPTVQSRIGGFYEALTSSAMFDWLAEYSTPASGTGQALQRGSFAGSITITPSNQATNLEREAIEAELVAQMLAGKLPWPDGNLLLMVNFPSKVRIFLGLELCQYKNFCSSHGTIAASAVGAAFDVPYVLLPEHSASTMCNAYCPISADNFENFTTQASKQLVAAVVDPGEGLTRAFAPPLAWYDQNKGAMDGLCDEYFRFTAPNGNTYLAQKQWSNALGDCLDLRAWDFKISLGPASAVLQAGSSVTFPVTTEVTRGEAQQIALVIDDPSRGVTGSFSPAIIKAGESSTLTLTAEAGAGSNDGTFDFFISGVGSVVGRHATSSVTVTGGLEPTGCPAGQHLGSNGVCVPDGCSSTGASASWLAALALGGLALLRRRSR